MASSAITAVIVFASVLRLPLSMLAFAVGVFFVCRVGLMLSYQDYFATLTLVELLSAFAHGIRFDLSISVIAFSPALLLMTIPVYKLQKTRWLQFLAWCCGTFLFLMIGLFIADIAYFGEVNRHLGQELLRLDSDLGAVLEIATTSRLPWTILGLTLIGIVAVMWHWWIVRPIAERRMIIVPSWWQRALVWLLAVIILTWFGRGLVIVSKPIDVVDAFTKGSQEQANLSLNGAFVVLKSLDDDHKNPLAFFNQEEFTRISQRQPAEPFRYLPNPRPRKNVVVFMLESWSFEYIDGLAGNGFGVTPFVDQLIDQSQVWTHFYAAGQRSIHGIQAALTSVPVLESQPSLGYGLELNRMSRIAELADQEGYETIMVQSSNRRSFHMDGIASSLGFEHYYGKEDLPLRRTYPQPAPRFGWDYEAMSFLGNKLSSPGFSQNPFFAFLFTGTTHEPFADPGKEFHRYDHDPAGLGGYLNTLRYSDWAIEQFMIHARSQPWYEDTVFIFTADHVLRASGNDLGNQFHIPLIIFSPGESIQPAVHHEVSSHYDLLPTFAELMGISAPVYTFGEPLLRPERGLDTLPAMLSKGSITGMIHSCGNTVFSEEGVIKTRRHRNPGECNLSDAQQVLQWRMQMADRLLRENRWIPSQDLSTAGSPPDDHPG